MADIQLIEMLSVLFEERERTAMRRIADAMREAIGDLPDDSKLCGICLETATSLSALAGGSKPGLWGENKIAGFVQAVVDDTKRRGALEKQGKAPNNVRALRPRIEVLKADD